MPSYKYYDRAKVAVDAYDEAKEIYKRNSAPLPVEPTWESILCDKRAGNPVALERVTSRTIINGIWHVGLDSIYSQTTIDRAAQKNSDGNLWKTLTKWDIRMKWRLRACHQHGH